MRQAYSVFPPRERARLAEQLVKLHGADPRLASELTKNLAIDLATITRVKELEARVSRIEQDYGLT